jgi:hypothetical protein
LVRIIYFTRQQTNRALGRFGAEPLWHVDNDLAYSFQCDEGLNIG